MKVYLTELEEKSYKDFKETCCRVNHWKAEPFETMTFALIVGDSNGIGQSVIASCAELNTFLDITDKHSW